MKKKRTNAIKALSMSLMIALLAGCGQSSGGASSSGAADYKMDTVAEESAYIEPQMAGMKAMNSMADRAYEDSYVEDIEEESDAGSGASGTLEAQNPQNTRKLITTIGLSGETDSVDKFNDSLEKEVTRLGGYIESSSIDNGSSYNRSKSASYTIRIPSEKMLSFVNGLTNQLNVTSKNTSTEDITLQYVDTKAHQEALEEEERQLLEILREADDLESIIAIQEQLTQVRYELNSIRSRIRLMDNQVDYGTVNLNVSEVTTYTETVEDNVWQRIEKGFEQNLEAVIDGITEFFIWLATHIPQIIFLLILVGIALLIIKILKKKGRLQKIKPSYKSQKKEEQPSGTSRALDTKVTQDEK